MEGFIYRLKERKSMWPQTGRQVSRQVGKIVDIDGKISSECLIFSVKQEIKLRGDAGIYGLE